MPETRRYFMQSIYLICEQLSKGTSIKPYIYFIDLIIKHLNSCTDEERKHLSEELYDVLGDFCF